MPAYLTVRQIGWREHGHAGRVHRRPQRRMRASAHFAAATINLVLRPRLFASSSGNLHGLVGGAVVGPLSHQ